MISPTKDLEMVCFTEWLLSVLKENSRTGAMCTVALVEAWSYFLTFHWTCVALCFTKGLPLVPKTVLGVCVKEIDKSGAGSGPRGKSQTR